MNARDIASTTGILKKLSAQAELSGIPFLGASLLPHHHDSSFSLFIPSTTTQVQVTLTLPYVTQLQISLLKSAILLPLQFFPENVEAVQFGLYLLWKYTDFPP